MGVAGKFIFLIRKKLSATDYEQERTLSKVGKVLGDVSTALMGVVVGAGMAHGFKLGSGGQAMPEQIFVPATLLTFSLMDLFSKLFYNAAKTEIPTLMSLMPFKKRRVVSVSFVYGMFCIPNLVMPLAVLSLMLVFWPYGAAPALWMLALAFVSGIVNTSTTCNIKNSFARRQYLQLLLSILAVVAFYAVEILVVKYWMLPSVFGENTFSIIMGIYLFAGLFTLTAAWALFVAGNKYPVSNAPAGKSIDQVVAKKRYSTGVMSTFLISEALRSPDIRKMVLMVLLCGVGLPLMSSFNVSSRIPYFHEIMISVGIFMPVATGSLTYSASSVFMDRLVTLPGNFLFRLLRVRFRICVLLMLVICTVILITAKNPDYMLIAGITMFAAGPVAVISHCSAAFFATRWDIMDGKARFIWNPFDLLSTAAYCAATFGAFVLAHYGYSKIAGMVYMAIGAAFVLSHDFWLNRIYATFRKRRYVLLDKYRNLD